MYRILLEYLNESVLVSHASKKTGRKIIQLPKQSYVIITIYWKTITVRNKTKLLYTVKRKNNL